MNTKACYRKLTNYKYQLMEEFHFQTNITGIVVETEDCEFIQLSSDGILTVLKNYAWDGASGPTVDTKNAMRGSLIHDALYQLLRLSLLTQNYVKPADQLFREVLVEDGMSKFRAWYWYRGLRLANGRAARPGTQEPKNVICAP